MPVLPAAATALDLVDAEVRELVRRRGLDPAVDPGPVRALVREVVADYADRASSSSLPPIADPEGVLRDVLDRVAGFGPLQRWLDDPEVEEIWVNEPGRVFVARRGRSELTTTILGAGELADLVERMLRTSGRRVDMSTPFVDASLPDGSRLHVVIPDITRRHMAVNIRKFVLQAHSLDELVALGTLTPQVARFLEASVAAGLNILVSGGTQAGKTTMLNCLCAAIPARERVVTAEEVFELPVPIPLHTCKPASTYDSHSTETGRDSQSHASARTAYGSAPTAAGRRSNTSTTTRARRRARRGRATRGCSPTSNAGLSRP
ncbi:Type II/IV secretion system protein [Klenkia marina]|uniref:Type II/IV secretion system protein n=1 Tax=Klenkia marina TaxID=1960309 RepID=A0A1G4X9U4_9ACTN|nr:ATPase, T2SS/T4P/T4SS family [Klenkia marina]SCX37999.1 Type II/IV secretion system protein [Klenkia marina]